MQLLFPVPLPPIQEWVRDRETRKEGQHQAGNCLKAPHLSLGPKMMRAVNISSFIHIPCICVSDICVTSKLLPHLREGRTLSFIPEIARLLRPLTYYKKIMSSVKVGNGERKIPQQECNC